MKVKEKLTYKDIKNLPEGNYEILNGEVKRLFPTSFEHGEFEGELYVFLKRHLKDKGYVAVGEVGILISKNPLKIRSADVVFISKKRSPQKPKGILEVPPELVIEIILPANTFIEVEEKVLDYLNIGVDKVLLIDPELKKVTLYERKERRAKIYDFNEEIELIENLKIRLSDIL